MVSLGGLLDLLGPNDYTIYESELESLNANISIQANKRIEASGSFSGNELLLATDRHLTLDVVGSGGGGIKLQGMPIRTAGQRQCLAAHCGQRPEHRARPHHDGGRQHHAGGAEFGREARCGPGLRGGAVTIAAKRIEFKAVQVFAPGTVITLNANTIEQKGSMELGAGATLSTGGTDFDNKKDAILAGSGHLDLGGGKLVNEGILRPGGSGAVGDLRVTGDIEMKGGESRLENRRGLRRQLRPLAGERLRQARWLAGAGAAGLHAPGLRRLRVLQAGSISSDFKNIEAPAFPGFAPVYGSTVVQFAGPLLRPHQPCAFASPYRRRRLPRRLRHRYRHRPAPAPAPSPAPSPAPAPHPHPHRACSGFRARAGAGNCGGASTCTAPVPAPAPAPAAAAPAPAVAPLPRQSLLPRPRTRTRARTRASRCRTRARARRSGQWHHDHPGGPAAASQPDRRQRLRNRSRCGARGAIADDQLPRRAAGRQAFIDSDRRRTKKEAAAKDAVQCVP
jgi:hypothetical protein